MLSSELKDTFLTLVRLGIGHGMVNGSRLTVQGSIDWQALKALADKQGLSAIVLDGLDKCHTDTTESSDVLPLQMKLEWIGDVLQNYEQRYEQYKRTIAEMAAFYEERGYKMMVLKGYACSLDWPKPNHRPCGDIDIWQFGQQRFADLLLERKNIEVDISHHHHTVFYWGDFMVENHYDFLNVHHHKSNVEMEGILKELASDPEKAKNVEMSVVRQLDGGEKEEVKVTVYLPSANLHALFLLRHTMSNFASTGMQLRQLMDWGFLVEKHGNEIDWDWLESQIEYFGMKKLYDIFNAILVGDLGFSVKNFPKVQFDPKLKDRVLDEILSPEFSEKEKGWIFRRAIFKFRRWKANQWKHELCFKESMWSAFWSGVWSHLLKPSSI